ncbi:MAG: tRNA pseudouridine(13) synthase TruD [Pseudohongiellaceae bacterium]
MPELIPTPSTDSAGQGFASLDSLAYAAGKPELAATLKTQPSDFCVDEQLGFTFTGKGEHLYLSIEKTNLSTVEVAKKLSEVSGVPKSAIGYSGMKDRRAETRQWFSLKLPAAREAKLASFEGNDLRILESHRNARKLKIGSHRSNHFKIVLRDCVGARSAFEDRLRRIVSCGVPNYFGVQRFGRDLSNLHQVQAWMAAELAQAAAGSAEGVTAGIGKQRFKRSMLLSAARSYLFNQLLSRRLQLGNWDSYVQGDVLNLNGTERSFSVANGAEWDQTLQQRLEQFDIHISGPLPGATESKDKYISYGKAADIEDAACKEFTTLLAGLRHFGVKAARRPLRFKAIDLEWKWLVNEEALDAAVESTATLQLEFSLYKGAYATSLLRELCVTREHGQ